MQIKVFKRTSWQKKKVISKATDSEAARQGSGAYIAGHQCLNDNATTYMHIRPFVSLNPKSCDKEC